MNITNLRAKILTVENFLDYGDVVSAEGSSDVKINGGTYNLYSELTKVDLSSCYAAVSIAECRKKDDTPYEVKFLERHPLGSQLFYPLFNHQHLIVVAPKGDQVSVDDIRVFIANAGQGVNYHKGVWHRPMLGISKGDRYLVIERSRGNDNCDEIGFSNSRVFIDCESVELTG